MNAIILSLYGSERKYCLGAVRNVELAKRFYPGWKTIIFADGTVSENWKRAIRRVGGEVRPPPHPMRNRKMWRLWAICSAEFDRVLLRDADSRPSEREATAVREWIESEKSFHVIRDHPAHSWPILPGTFGARGLPGKSSLSQLLESAVDLPEGKWEEPKWWAVHVWPRIWMETLVHDTCCMFAGPEIRMIPGGSAGSFIGQVVEVNGSLDVPTNDQEMAKWRTIQIELRKRILANWEPA